MMKIMLIRTIVIVSLLFVFSTQAQAAVIFLDEFDTLSGWNTQGTVDSRDHHSVAPSGNPVARIMATGEGESWAVMEQTIDTTGFSNIILSYFRHTHNVGGLPGDRLVVGWKLSTDSDWNILQRTIHNKDWEFFSWSLLGEADDTLIDIGFRVRNIRGDVGRGFVDDVQLTGTRIGGPVPEPATVILLGSGLLGAGIFKRRKKHS